MATMDNYFGQNSIWGSNVTSPRLITKWGLPLTINDVDTKNPYLSLGTTVYIEKTQKHREFISKLKKLDDKYYKELIDGLGDKKLTPVQKKKLVRHPWLEEELDKEGEPTGKTHIKIKLKKPYTKAGELNKMNLKNSNHPIAQEIVKELGTNKWRGVEDKNDKAKLTIPTVVVTDTTPDPQTGKYKAKNLSLEETLDLKLGSGAEVSFKIKAVPVFVQNTYYFTLNVTTVRVWSIGSLGSADEGWTDEDEAVDGVEETMDEEFEETEAEVTDDELPEA